MTRNPSHSLLIVAFTCVIGVAGDEPKAGLMCTLHKVRLVQEEVPILYGKPLTSQEYSQARGSQFPNARERCVIGGCIPNPEKQSKVMVCPRCSEARKQWLSTHPVKDTRI